MRARLALRVHVRGQQVTADLVAPNVVQMTTKLMENVVK
jgi:hypothetical protein